MRRMTMEDVKGMTCDFITPAVAASVLKMDTGRLIGYAKAGELPFPVQISGNRVKISRKGFLAWHDRKEPEPEADEKMMQELHKMNVQLTGIAVMMAFMMPRLAPGYMDRVTEIVDKLDKEVKQ